MLHRQRSLGPYYRTPGRNRCRRHTRQDHQVDCRLHVIKSALGSSLALLPRPTEHAGHLMKQKHSFSEIRNGVGADTYIVRQCINSLVGQSTPALMKGHTQLPASGSAVLRKCSTHSSNEDHLASEIGRIFREFTACVVGDVHVGRVKIQRKIASSKGMRAIVVLKINRSADKAESEMCSSDQR